MSWARMEWALSCFIAVNIYVLFGGIKTCWAVAEPDSDPIQVSYSPIDGFHIPSEDGNYLLRIGAEVGMKAEPSWTEGVYDSSGTFSFVRPFLRGNMYRPWFRYLFSMELAEGTPYLLGALINVQPWDTLGFTFGQQLTPVSRHESFGPAQIFFPDYASAANYFWSGRSRGLTVYGVTAKPWFNYYLGVYDGSPINQSKSVPLNYVVEGRTTVNPIGPVNANEFPFTPEGRMLPERYSFTLQGYFGKIQTNAASYNPTNSILTPVQTTEVERTSTGGADVWYQRGRVIGLGECYWRHLRPERTNNSFNSIGAWGQVIVNAYENKIGFGTRVNWLNPNLNISNDQATEVEGQVAWFIQPSILVLKLRYAWLHQDSPDAQTLGNFQLPFVVGTSNVATLQLNLNL